MLVLKANKEKVENKKSCKGDAMNEEVLNELITYHTSYDKHKGERDLTKKL